MSHEYHVPFDQPVQVFMEEDMLAKPTAPQNQDNVPAQRKLIPFDQLLVSNLYKIRYNFFQSRSIEDIRQRGVYVTGNKKFDNQAKNETVDGIMTIRMAMDLYKRGVDMWLVNHSELMGMYNEVNDFLNQAIRRVKDSPNAQEDTVRDIIEVDAFCKIIFEHAKFDLKVSQDVHEFVRAASNGQALPLMNDSIFVDPNTNYDDRVAEAQSIQYNSSEDMLLQRLALLHGNSR